MAIVAGFVDSFDGAVAKAEGRPSKFGALLDSTTDRLSDALYLPAPRMALRGRARYRRARHADDWVAAVALVALVSWFMVSYVKARAESSGFNCDVGIAERAERLIVIIAALILDFVPLGVACSRSPRRSRSSSAS